MQVVQWDPFKEMEQMMNEMNSALMHKAGAHHMTSTSKVATPITDIFEEKGKLVIHMHIAGLTDKEIDMNVEGNMLIISGNRDNSKDAKKRNYIMRESSTELMRRLSLPKNADTSKIKAHLSDGVLRIEIGMKEKTPTQKINIKSKK